MTERDIFLAWLDLPDAAARSAYLEKTCDGDSALRGRVEALLQSHDGAGSFLGEPAQPPAPVDPGATQALGDNAAPQEREEADDNDLSFLAASTRPDSLGRIGHYEVLQVLGKGGFGIVFRAFDEVLHRVVAVKVLAPQLAATSPARKRFLREARSSAQVRHENVVQVYEVGEQPLPYIAMEFIPGETLQQRLDRTGPLEVADVVRIGRQIAEELAAAHAMDLIHRDIKPGNVLLEGGAQRVKITDFGLARAADDASLSQSGLIAGTPMYMAPEQAKGETLDQRADLFSLGSILYVMATGRPPFRATGMLGVLKRVAEDNPRPIREVIPETPQWLCDVIAKLHAKNPEERFQSARETADVLADCEAQLKARGEGRGARGEKKQVFSRPSPRVSRPSSTGRWKWVAAAMVVFAGLGVWFGPAAMLYSSGRGELEILPGQGLVEVIVLCNPEGAIDENKLHASVTDWLSMKEGHTLTLSPGTYQLNVGTWPAGTVVSQWEVTTSGLFGADLMAVPVVSSSAIVAVERGRRVTLRPIMRPAPTTDLPKNDAEQLVRQKQPEDKGPPKEITNTLGMKFKFIPAGKFTMGSSQEEIDRCLELFGENDWEKERLPTEGPEHPVKITQPFYLGATEVTVGQFRRFVDEDGYQVGDGRWRNPGFDQTDEHPVVWVSWNNAVDFCNWLSKKEGKEYRLPTEAEWEYSCRAGKAGTRYCFGDDEAQLENYAWYDKNSGGGTHSVAKKKPNDWGLYDMHGNAWEWCQDYHDANSYKDGLVKDPMGPGAGIAREARGGSWIYGPVLCRSTFRGQSFPDEHNAEVGFRVLLVAPPGGIPTNGVVKSTPPLAIDPDRRAAEYVLSVGGVVEINRDSEITAVVKLPKSVFRLTRVGLGNNPDVTDAGLAAFNDCQNLNVLDLTGAAVTDAGLAHLAGLSELTNLLLAKTKATAKGVEELAKALPKCKITWDGGVIEPK